MIFDVYLRLSAILSTQKAAKSRPFGHTFCSGALSTLPLNIQITSVLTEFTQSRQVDPRGGGSNDYGGGSNDYGGITLEALEIRPTAHVKQVI